MGDPGVGFGQQVGLPRAYELCTSLAQDVTCAHLNEDYAGAEC